jgi:NADPH:quinone reductase-like Zn-dependent oxidoreductase
MTTMKAVPVHTYGGPEVLVYEEAPCPEVGTEDVLIRVFATSVNPFDWKVREGYLAAWMNHKLPLILGWDVSGVVQTVGSGVTNFSPGDQVFARADVNLDGAYAEYIAVEASLVVPKPDSLDHIHAAAVPHAALAAWHSMFSAADLSSGQTMLIHGAAGGVGHFAVQFAKWRGAKVIGTASGNNLEFLHQLGVDEAIDYTTTRFDEVVRDVDVVLDTIGGEVLERCWVVLKPGGMLVSLVEAPSEETAIAYGVRQSFAGAQADAGILTQIAALVDSGQIKPTVSTILPLDEVRQAHELSQSMHTRGKIVLQIVDI